MVLRLSVRGGIHQLPAVSNRNRRVKAKNQAGAGHRNNGKQEEGPLSTKISECLAEKDHSIGWPTPLSLKGVARRMAIGRLGNVSGRGGGIHRFC